MPRPLKPPRGIFIATQVIFHPALSPALKDTLLRLMALAWASGGHFTPPLSYAQLAALTGRSLRSLHAHLSELRDTYAALRLQRAGDGNFIIVFNDAVLPPQKMPSNCKSLHQPDQEEEEEEVNIPGEDLLLLDDHYDHSGAKVQNFAQTPPFSLQSSAQTPLSAQFLDGLQAAGVFASLLDEVAASRRSEEDLRALLAWAQAEQPENPAPLFIARLRAGARAPEAYYQPPCPRCGQYGKHSPECSSSSRYLSGPYAEFIEH